MFGSCCNRMLYRLVLHRYNWKNNQTMGNLYLKLLEQLKFYSTTSNNQEPIKVKLDDKIFNSVLTPEVLHVNRLFKENGYELRIVGGAVRDLLMGKSADDLDLCTTATPAEMKDMYHKAGIRVLTLSGEKHGTVSIRINDKQNFDVTTLRIDIKTDGRHAVVQFTKDWRLDALRRDLTINSLFLDFDGYIYDYFNGLEDVKNRRVRFVDNADKRIKEDYLRILRYFRFYGRIAEHPNDHEESTLQPIRQNVHGLDNISGQRILIELKKLVLGRLADDILKVMIDTGVTKYTGLSSNLNLEEFSRVCRNTEHNQPQFMTRTAALFTDKDQLEELHSRLFLSNKEKSLGAMILDYRDKVDVNDIDSITKHLCLNVVIPRGLLKQQMSELCKYQGNTDMAVTVMEQNFPMCPVNQLLLSNVKRIRRKYAEDAMTFLCTNWVNSGYRLDKEQLLELSDQFIEENKDKYDNLLYKEPKVKKK